MYMYIYIYIYIIIIVTVHTGASASSDFRALYKCCIIIIIYLVYMAVIKN